MLKRENRKDLMRISLKVIALICILLCAAGCGLAARFTSAGQPTAQTVQRNAAVMSTTVQSSFNLVGNVSYAQSSQLTWQTSGVIKNVAVKIGDQVKQGAILAELSEDSLESSVLSAANSLITAQDALQDVMESSIKKTQALATLTAAEITYQATKQAQEALYFPRATELDIQMAYDNYQLAVQNYENAKEDYRVVLVNYKGWEDAARTTYYQSYKSAYDNLVSAYQTWNYKKGVPDDINLGAAQGAVLSAQKAFEDALTDYSSYQTLPRTEDLQSAKVNVSTAEKNFNKRFITAPFDGTVTAVFAESGRFVKEKAAAVQLDDMSGYFINLNTSEIDITKISADQKVLVEFDAIPGKVYNGIVRQIAESGKVSDSNVTFATQVEVVDADSKIKSGMTSEVTILTGEMTQVLQVPVNAILNEDGKSYVQKVNGTEIIKIEVETGLVSDNLIVVAAADLSEGDLVSVSEAAQPQQAIGTPPAFGAATPPAESSQE